MESKPNLKKIDVKAIAFETPLVVAELLQYIAVAISICIVIYVFIATPNQVGGASMEPNFYGGDVIVTNKLVEWLGDTPFGKGINLDYQRGDVVVFQKPGINDFIKRIVGVPGDKIAIRDGYIYINGKKVIEDYLPPSTFTEGGSYIMEGSESLIIPAEQYAVIGDNRGKSHDSRAIDIGFVDRKWLKGKVILRYWPLNRFGLVETGKYTEE
jgi:signal peptidase I